jgi:predicted metal-dependent RNase
MKKIFDEVTSEDVRTILEDAAGCIIISEKGMLVTGEREAVIPALAKALNDEEIARMFWHALAWNDVVNDGFPGGSVLDR